MIEPVLNFVSEPPLRDLKGLDFTSIFKFNKELVCNNAPVPNGIFPLSIDFDQCQIDALENGIICRENSLFGCLSSKH